MLSLSLNTAAAATQYDGHLIFLPENFSLAGQHPLLLSAYPHADKILKQHHFAGKKGDCYTLSAEQDGNLVHFIFLGMSSKTTLSPDQMIEQMRRIIAHGIKVAKKLQLKTIAAQLPTCSSNGHSASEKIEQLGIAALMMSYSFEKFKSENKQEDWEATLTFIVDQVTPELEKAISQASIIGNAINQITRHLADLPPNVATPTFLSLQAKEIAEKYNLQFDCFGRDKALSLNMGGFCSVDIGSEEEGKFVILEYKTTKANAPTIALCGKGVTFDTGGISLKPSNYMCGMKFDMSGAAAVMGVMAIVGQLKPEINVIGLAPFVENMPSGKASRQDDIITHLNGKTTEIKNTDAEGRLILSDTLAYAEKFYSPDIIIDIATLTGACVVALGHFYTGLLSNNEALKNDLLASGKKTGDRVWELPLDDDYRDGILSDVADIANIALPSYSAGTIEGAVYLQHFVQKAAWAHLDIAGTAHDVPTINYVGKGATGASVRLLIDYILSRAA